jgi:hypothetical protein
MPALPASARLAEIDDKNPFAVDRTRINPLFPLVGSPYLAPGESVFNAGSNPINYGKIPVPALPAQTPIPAPPRPWSYAIGRFGFRVQAIQEQFGQFDRPNTIFNPPKLTPLFYNNANELNIAYEGIFLVVKDGYGNSTKSIWPNLISYSNGAGPQTFTNPILNDDARPNPSGVTTPPTATIVAPPAKTPELPPTKTPDAPPQPQDPLKDLPQVPEIVPFRRPQTPQQPAPTPKRDDPPQPSQPAPPPAKPLEPQRPDPEPPPTEEPDAPPPLPQPAPPATPSPDESPLPDAPVIPQPQPPTPSPDPQPPAPSPEPPAPSPDPPAPDPAPTPTPSPKPQPQTPQQPIPAPIPGEVPAESNPKPPTGYPGDPQFPTAPAPDSFPPPILPPFDPIAPGDIAEFDPDEVLDPPGTLPPPGDTPGQIPLSIPTQPAVNPGVTPPNTPAYPIAPNNPTGIPQAQPAPTQPIPTAPTANTPAPPPANTPSTPTTVVPSIPKDAKTVYQPVVTDGTIVKPEAEDPCKRSEIDPCQRQTGEIVKQNGDKLDKLDDKINNLATNPAAAAGLAAALLATPVTVKKFVKCNQETPEFTTQVITVPAFLIPVTIEQFERLANIEAKFCESCDAIASTPEGWANRTEYQRPQTILIYRELKADGTLGKDRYSCAIPHSTYDSKPTTKPAFSNKQNGNIQATIKLKDNSSIIVYCRDEAEAQARINEMLAKVKEDKKTGKNPKFTKHPEGTFKEIALKAWRLDHYPNGASDGASPAWMLRL